MLRTGARLAYLSYGGRGGGGGGTGERGGGLGSWVGRPESGSGGRDSGGGGRHGHRLAAAAGHMGHGHCGSNMAPASARVLGAGLGVEVRN